MATQKIDKLEAASRQLNTAISLWFSNGDAVSVHTLACSAYQIVHDINEQRGGRDLLYNSLVIKEECHQKVNRTLKHSYNFFKHAEKDATDTIEFNPKGTELFILFTLFGLEILGQKPDEIRGAFVIYWGLLNPNSLTPKGHRDIIESIPKRTTREDILKSPKQRFFNAYLERLKGR